jgi:hypothetical protein
MRKTNQLLFYEFFNKSFYETNSYEKKEATFSTYRELYYSVEEDFGFNLKSDCLFYYNNHQKLEKIECFDVDLEICFSVSFEYDHKSRLITQKGWNKDYKETFEYQVIYNDEAQSTEVNYLINGQLEDTRLAIFEGEKKMWDQFKDANYELITTYEYNHFGQLIQSREVLNKQFIASINYDYEGDLLKQRTDRNVEDVINSNTEYQYDEKKRLKLEQLKYSDNELTICTSFDYDSCNNIIRRATNEGLVETKRSEIVHDTNGNWIKEDYWLKGKLNSIRERHIKYLN